MYKGLIYFEKNIQHVLSYLWQHVSQSARLYLAIHLSSLFMGSSNGCFVRVHLCLLYVDFMLAHLIKYLTTHSSLSLSFNKNKRHIPPSLLSAAWKQKNEVISASNQIRAAAEPLSSVTHPESRSLKHSWDSCRQTLTAFRRSLHVCSSPGLWIGVRVAWHSWEFPGWHCQCRHTTAGFRWCFWGWFNFDIPLALLYSHQEILFAEDISKDMTQFNFKPHHDFSEFCNRTNLMELCLLVQTKHVQTPICARY